MLMTKNVQQMTKCFDVENPNGEPNIPRTSSAQNLWLNDVFCVVFLPEHGILASPNSRLKGIETRNQRVDPIIINQRSLHHGLLIH